MATGGKSTFEVFPADDDFCDYDDDGEQSVGIYEVSGKFERI